MDQPKPNPPASLPPNRQKNCLLLDDDEDFVNLVSQFLEAQGYWVSTAANGLEGLKKIAADDFDVVLCDMVMPHLPGDLFFIAVERTKPVLCKRFIFMTAHQDDHRVNTFLKRVNGRVILKPLQLVELDAAILETIASADAADDAAKA